MGEDQLRVRRERSGEKFLVVRLTLVEGKIYNSCKLVLRKEAEKNVEYCDRGQKNVVS